MRVRWKMKQHEIGFYQKNVGLSLRPLWLFPRISNFWPPKGAIKRKKAKPIPTIHHHRGAINCVWVFNFSSFWVRFKRFLWLSILTEWYPLFLCGDRLLFWVHKNVEKWPTIHISIEATFAFLRANFLGSIPRLCRWQLVPKAHHECSRARKTFPSHALFLFLHTCLFWLFDETFRFFQLSSPVCPTFSYLLMPFLPWIFEFEVVLRPGKSIPKAT